MFVQHIKRREFLMFGRNALVMSALSGGLAACAKSGSPLVVDWSKIMSQLNQNGGTTVRKVIGTGMAGRTPLSANQFITAGTRISVDSDSQLFLELADYSVLKISGKASLTLNLDKQSGGELDVHYGSLLAAITPRGRRRYIIKGTAAMIGVKGTVCFIHVFEGSDLKDTRIPTDTTDYFCLCNGLIDFLNPANSQLVWSDKATYHNARLVKPVSDGITLQKTGFLLNHSDKEILELIDLMKGKKLDRHWLRLGNNGYK